ncbi:alpha-L-Rha alpha-1,3-L-rhamnosyltransferase [Photobacterium aphoticum]|uniref:Alpha-L-Rha alpha-1,3-L-rhamnosyltransferase n=1 Tax=Photobacterium aphoticum TaxID=754436 RepID=A0A090R2U1_9GAMM|nr:alpha-L-Rha alpha-1,3-L-rhamnosyltransferase [Photobacterium aphoticum]
MRRVCVLLAAYNGQKWIKEQIESILIQKDVILDIYISLDVSSDNTLELIENISNELSNLYILPYGEKYGSAGRNFFRLLMDVDFSNYDYVSFSDQDDIWLENKLISSIKNIENSYADAYSGNVIAFWSGGTKKLIKKDHPQKEFDYLFESAGPGCTFVLKKKLALHIKNDLISNKDDIEQLWLHDWYCYSHARSNGYKWVIGNQPLMLYRQHELNQVGANSGMRAMLNRAKVVLSGEAFDKVIIQSNFIGQKEIPIQLLKKNTFSSLLHLLLLSMKCRRSNKEAVMFFIAVTLLSFKRLLGGA